MRGLLLSFFILCFIAGHTHAQQLPVTEAEVKQELLKRGIDEELLRSRLAQEGINLDEIESLTPVEIVRLQEIIEELESASVSITEQSGMALDTIPDQEKEKKEAEIKADDKIFETEEESKPDIDKAEVDLKDQIYGLSLFKERNVKVFNQSEQTQAPEAYVLGPGDQIAVSIYGVSQLEESYTIDNDGYIRILDGKQRVLLKGSTIRSARQKLYRIFSNYYRFTSGQFDVGLSISRTVEIGIYGEVVSPGSYSLDAINTVFNALAAVNGPGQNGSLRKIQLIKSTGTVVPFDLYEFMSNPSIEEQFYLEDNDIIFVPVQSKIVMLEGAVRREMKFEMLDEEGLMDLLLYAGGLKGNAYKKTFRLLRYDENQRIALDIPYQELLDGNRDFKLEDGDEIFVETIDEEIKNFVEVNGEVVNAGVFERRPNMRISELLTLAGLKPQSKTDLAPLQRLNADSTIVFEFLDLDQIIANPGAASDIILRDNDKLTVWPSYRFSDRMYISVEGSVRFPGEFPYDNSQTVRVSEAITLAGGLQRDAGDFAIIHRSDPLRPNLKQYIRVNLAQIRADVNSDQNIVMTPFDRIEIFSENLFEEETYISISGAVNNPGEFQYGRGMTVAEALNLARGFKLAAATNNIEVSRIIIKDNEPTKTIIASLSIDRDFNNATSEDANFVLEPFDYIFVRFVPEFEMQQNVEITGEVQFPGGYSIISNNERISSLIERSGGLTEEAFPAGAKLFRSMDNTGYIVMRLDEVMKDPRSRYNYILKEGDRIEIPKQKDFVTIRGAVRVKEVVLEEIVGESNEIKVAYHKGKKANFYIDYYAGGIAENGSKSRIFVEHPNGEIKQTKRKFIFGWRYPEVRKGSVITVGVEPPEIKEENGEKEEVDWTKVLGDSVAQAMSVLTLILLIQRLD